MPHSAWTARTAFSRPSRRTTTAMVNSLDPCAMAMMFTFTREIAVKIRPASPGLPCMPSPTAASRPDLAIHLDGMHVAMRQLQRQRRFERLHGSLELLGPHQEAEFLPVAGAGKHQHLDVGAGQRIERPGHHLDAVQLGAGGLERNQRHLRHGGHRARAIGRRDGGERSACPAFRARSCSCSTPEFSARPAARAFADAAPWRRYRPARRPRRRSPPRAPPHPAPAADRRS